LEGYGSFLWIIEPFQQRDVIAVSLASEHRTHISPKSVATPRIKPAILVRACAIIVRFRGSNRSVTRELQRIVNFSHGKIAEIYFL
jgi:hypothetical protein